MKELFTKVRECSVNFAGECFKYVIIRDRIVCRKVVKQRCTSNPGLLPLRCNKPQDSKDQDSLNRLN